MNSYLFHDGDETVAPAPPEYVEFTQERAVWQALGKTPEQLSAREFYRTTLFLQSEAEQQQRKKQN